MKYLKKFETTQQYEQYISGGVILPNVSLCEDTNSVYYNPLPPPYSGFCELTLSDGTIVEIEGSGELTPTQVEEYRSDAVGVRIGTLCTSIGSDAFADCSSLTSIEIPNSVTSIGGYAFYDTPWWNTYSADTSHQYGNIVYINDIAYKCTSSSITSVTFRNNTVSIGGQAFYECDSLTSIVIPDSVTSIGYQAFSDCYSLTSVTIGNGVTSIGNEAFYNCSSLTSITIPNSVTSIGSDAFADCSSLTSIEIPNSVTSIGSYAFGGTPWWDTYSADTSHQYGNIVYINDIAYKCTSSSITSVTFRNNTVSIGDRAFRECSLTSIVIPDSVTSIGYGAFYGCSSLTSVTIGSGVTSISNGSFNSCSSLTNVTIPDSVTSIGDSAFNSCYGLTSIAIPNSVTSIGNSAFEYCSRLTSVNIPSGVTSIGEGVFNDCSSLTSIVIPDSVTSINNYAFQDCGSLASIISLATTAPTITSNTFRNVKTGGTLTVPVGSSGYDVWMGTGNYYLGKYNWTKVEQ